MSIAIDENGTIHHIDSYYYAGVGLPDHLTWISDVTPERAAELLPKIVVAFDGRIRALDDRIAELHDWLYDHVNDIER